MDHNNQKNHLKAYGIVFFSLEVGLKSKWLLNYDGGAFLIENNKIVENECKIRGVSYQIISDAKAQIILQEIAAPSSNKDAVTLEKAPKNCGVFSKRQNALGRCCDHGFNVCRNSF